ncbi:MAG: DNA primase [Bacteroidota bacterium]|nr:DNA primase [Bacteroidota bacterium]
MIAESSIQQVFETADIVEVIQRCGIELKKSGSNWMGLSPFNKERTPSFSVSPSKQIFKCFSSGNGGNVVTFLMTYKGLSFPEAIKELAQMYHLQLEYSGEEISEDKKELRLRLQEVLEYARIKWKTYLREAPPEQSDFLIELHGKRKLSRSTLDKWEIGFAPDSWDFLKSELVPKGRYGEAKQLGILNEHTGKTFDVFRNRIIFPIRNHVGNLVGFGGRAMADQGPKYLNSSDSDLYNKSKVLYGLHFAGPAIRKMGFVNITEGYFDVISMHQAGLENTVATCGTSLSPSHAKLLKRYTSRARLMFDGDAAGQKAMERTLPILLREGFKIELTLLPDNQDPDDLCRSFAEYEEPEETRQSA